MKYFLIVVLFLFSLKANALDVIASGCGDNYEQAVTAAKVDALDRVNGAWVHGDSYVRDNMFKEKITQYNGGVLAKYEVLKNYGNCVSIKADVVPRSNKVETNTAKVPASMQQHLNGKVDEASRLRQAVGVLDNRSKAIAFVTKNIEFRPSGTTTIVVIEGEVSIQDKWKADYFDLQKMAGWFNLHSFYKPLSVNVKGYDYGKEVVASTFSFYDDLTVYRVTTDGVVINPNKTDMVRLTIRVPTAKLEHVDTFEVTFL